MQNGAAQSKWCEKFSHHFFFAMCVISRRYSCYVQDAGIIRPAGGASGCLNPAGFSALWNHSGGQVVYCHVAGCPCGRTGWGNPVAQVVSSLPFPMPGKGNNLIQFHKYRGEK